VVTELLRRLIAVDTSNPPGDETAAAALVADLLQSAGVETEIVAKEPARGNLVARLPGGGGPSLMFLCHLDVAPAKADEWDVHPFAGIARDGWIHGRGAVDMKCQVAAVATALAQLGCERVTPPGDVLLVAVADEEVGEAQVGLPWLVEERPEIATDFAIGEGAGERYEIGGRPTYLLDVGVKQGCNVTLRVDGRSGDASLPGAGENALLELARLLGRLPSHLGDFVGPEAEEILRALKDDAPGEALERVLDALTSITVVPTEAKAGEAANVTAPSAEATIKCALPPRMQKDDLEAHLRAALGEGRYELELSDPLGGSTSPTGSPLHRAVESFLAEHDPEADLLPTLGYGYSDCHVLREAFGTTTYGFIPFRHADPLVNLDSKHGPNERVLVADLEFQVACARFLATYDFASFQSSPWPTSTASAGSSG
jgi:acetylornithine deacetylase/succinyl-diaminopimelate desuccinylase-like protein